MAKDKNEDFNKQELTICLPQAQIASIEILNRMRVVETILTMDKVNRFDSKNLKTDILNKLVKKEEDRLHISNVSQQNVTGHGLFSDSIWNIPYDVSEDTIDDGVKWFQHLYETLDGDSSYLTMYIEVFQKQLLSITTKSNLTIPFEKLIINLATEQTYSQIMTKSDDMPVGLNVAVTNQQKFTNFIVSLSNEFKRIYDDSALINF